VVQRTGVVAAASYEARKFGVRSATSGVMAKSTAQRLFLLSQGLIGIKKFQARFKRFFMSTDLVEPLSLDEAYLDVTQNKNQVPVYCGRNQNIFLMR
jgi:DNA polymerase-4